MQFTLYYSGPLKANADAATKHELRLHFHSQLEVLWNRPPLTVRWGPKVGLNSSTPGALHVGPYAFLPIVAPEFEATAELSIQLLRSGPPGQIVSHSGDIDNRLKTLFDALSVPQLNQLPQQPPPNTPPVIFCVLSDDKLITSVHVRTLELLTPIDPRDAIVIVEVRTHISRLLHQNAHMV